MVKEFFLRASWSFWDKLGLVATVLVACVLVFNNQLGRLEGRFFPVVDRTTITSAILIDEFSTEIKGGSYNLRDCTLIDVRWFIGTVESYSQTQLVSERGIRQGDDKEFVFGPWAVQLNANELANNSFAIMYHNCHPFWTTQTYFWTTDDNILIDKSAGKK